MRQRSTGRRTGKDLRPNSKQRANALQRLADLYALRRESELALPDFAEAMTLQPTVEPALAQVGLPVILVALRASDDPDALNFVTLHDSISPSDLTSLSWDAIACACGIGSKRLLEVSQSALHAYGSALSTMLLANAMPKIVKTSIKMAQTLRGVDDRMAMLKAGAILPVPKGSQVALQINTTVPALPPAEAVPEWSTERHLRAIHEAGAFGQAHQLPAGDGQTPPILEGEVEEVDTIRRNAAAAVDAFGVEGGT